MGELINLLISIVLVPSISAGLFSFIGAVFLKYIVNLVTKNILGYWESYKITFIAVFGSYVVGFTLGVPDESIFSLLIAFIVQTLVFFYFLECLGEGKGRLKESFLISLIFTSFFGLLIFLVGMMHSVLN